MGNLHVLHVLILEMACAYDPGKKELVNHERFWLKTGINLKKKIIQNQQKMFLLTFSFSNAENCVQKQFKNVIS